jgi:hypothetical protein
MSADELRAELARRHAGAQEFLRVRDAAFRQIDELREKLAAKDDELRTIKARQIKRDGLQFQNHKDNA